MTGLVESLSLNPGASQKPVSPTGSWTGRQLKRTVCPCTTLSAHLPHLHCCSSSTNWAYRRLTASSTAHISSMRSPSRPGGNAVSGCCSSTLSLRSGSSEVRKISCKR